MLNLVNSKVNCLIASLALGLALASAAMADANADVVVPLKNSATIIDNSYTDTYDPSAGPYGGDNVMGAPTITTGNAMPSYSAPSGLATKTGERKYDGGSHTLSGELECDKFLVVNKATITVEGDVTLVVKEEFKVQNKSRIILAEDATLTIYCLKDATVQDYAELNPDMTRPQDVTIYKLGDKEFIIQNESMVVGQMHAPKTFMQVENGAHFYGTLEARSMYLKNEAGAHFCNPGAATTTTVEPLYD